VSLSGCGQGTKTVKGTVTMEGEPFPDATVTFYPVDAEGKTDPNGKNASGTTDANGNFSLGTFKAGDGAMPGQYKVTITKMALVQATGQAGAGAMREVMMAQQKAARASRKEQPQVAARYGQFDKTELRAKVPPDGPVNFDLTKK
jgi:hypothetical protein